MWFQFLFIVCDYFMHLHAHALVGWPIAQHTSQVPCHWQECIAPALAACCYMEALSGLADLQSRP